MQTFRWILVGLAAQLRARTPASRTGFNGLPALAHLFEQMYRTQNRLFWFQSSSQKSVSIISVAALGHFRPVLESDYEVSYILHPILLRQWVMSLPLGADEMSPSSKAGFSRVARQLSGSTIYGVSRTLKGTHQFDRASAGLQGLPLPVFVSKSSEARSQPCSSHIS